MYVKLGLRGKGRIWEIFLCEQVHRGLEPDTGKSVRNSPL